MPEAKRTLAEKRIAFLKEYFATIEAIEDRALVDTARVGEKYQALDDRLAVDRPELVRVAAEVGHRISTADGRPEVRKMVKVLIREWERADETAKESIGKLKAFMSEVRQLDEMETNLARLDRAIEDIGYALSKEHKVRQELAPQIIERRESLGEDQHELERILRNVGRSFRDQLVARGAHGIVDFLAGEVTAAVGAYREWPTTRYQPTPRRSAPSAPPPIAPSVTIHNSPSATASNTVNVTVTNVLEQLARAIDQAAPEEKKGKWREVVNDIASSAAGAGVKAALEKLLGSGA